jgi:hypothetical protein
MSGQQNSCTPREFIDAVEAKFGIKFGFDIACTRQDCVIPITSGLSEPRGYYFNPVTANVHPKQLQLMAEGWIEPEVDLLPSVNALDQDWSLIQAEHSFLNPPWKKTKQFAAKASQGTDSFVSVDDRLNIWKQGTRIWSLFPAGVGSSWFRDYVLGKTACYFLSPRLVFTDPRTGKPFVVDVKNKAGEVIGQRQQTGLNDCLLIDWSPPEVGCWCWTWKQPKARIKKVNP